MSDHIIVIETGYKRGSANYRIELTDAMSRAESLAEFDALRAGTSDRLPAVDGARIIDLCETQFLRVRSRLGATMLDRVTLGPVAVQRA